MFIHFIVELFCILIAGIS